MGFFVAVFALLASAHSAIAAPPTVTSLNPNSDYVAGGSKVTILGTNFTGASAVKFGTTNASSFTVDNATTITATVPAHAAGNVSVRVMNPDGTSAHASADTFRYEAPPTYTVIYKFRGGGDLGFPIGWLIADRAGNLYGVASGGGPENLGGVFMLSPPDLPGGQWTRTILYAFNSASGGSPIAGVVADRQGRLYGTTVNGNAFGVGGVFRLTPPPAQASLRRKWRYENLYSFQGTADDGQNPDAGVIVDQDGNVYGVTKDGGVFANGLGVIYKLTATPSGPWQFRKLHVFTAPAYSQGRLRLDADGAIWGTTEMGGANNAGTVFKLVPPAGMVTRAPRVIHSFTNSSADGSFPTLGRLIVDADGNMFGTTSGGGPSGFGAIYQLVPRPAPSTAFDESPLFFFDGSIYGNSPVFGVNLTRKGALVGAAIGGGGGGSGKGVIFKLVPPAGGQSNWTPRALRTFADDDPLGDSPFSEVLVRGGTMFGSTFEGGHPTCKCGLVFMIVE